ncbi:hypothetical protein AK812_SmicGene45900, partial [Symbiodinium microadriaticum]
VAEQYTQTLIDAGLLSQEEADEEVNQIYEAWISCTSFS